MKVYAVFQESVDDWDSNSFIRYVFSNKAVAEQCADVLRGDEEEVGEYGFYFRVEEIEVLEEIPEEAFLK